jgi:PAS domain S-box-containing protein
MLRAAIEAFADLFFLLDSDGTILDYHAAPDSQLYVAPEIFLSRRTQDVLPPEVGARFASAIASVADSGQAVEIEYSLPMPDGERSYEARLRPIGAGQLILVIRDMSEQKRAEEELQYRAEFEELVANVSARFINIATDEIDATLDEVMRTLGEFVGVDSCSTSLLDEKAGHLVLTHRWFREEGEPLFPIGSRFPLEEFSYLWGQQERHGAVHIRSLAELPPEAEKERRWLEATGYSSFVMVPIEYGGRLVGQMGLHSRGDAPSWSQNRLTLLRSVCNALANALQRKQHEEALRQSEARLRTLFENSPDIILTIDRADDVTYINHTRAGVSWDDVVGKNLYQLIPGGTHAEVRGALKRVQESRELPVQLEHLGLDGSWWSIRMVPIEAEKTDAQTLVFCTDISKRKRAEVLLEQHRDQLEELVRRRTAELEKSREELNRAERLASIGTLSAGVAHQINNPIGAIVASAEYALICEGDSDRYRVWKEALNENVVQAKRCGEIVRSLLQFAREEPTRRSLEDMHEIVRRACYLSSNYASKRGSAIEFELSAEPAPVRVNPIEMEQVMVNLIRNAIESRETGSLVRVRSECGLHSVRIEVKDNGGGIDAETRKHVFDPFFTTRLHEGGSGLGLSVAHGIVANHGGSLQVQSELGTGTSVTLEMPLDRNPSLDRGGR